MKLIKHLAALIVLFSALILLSTLPAKAADYAVQKTFWSFAGTWTNSATVNTNLNAAIDLTQVTDFVFSVVASTTNNTGGGGGLNFLWETSADGTNWPQDTNSILNNVGWFAVPIQSNNVLTAWNTNITVNAVGYWRIRYMTNASGNAITNIAIRGYVKPKRTNRDY